MCERNFFQVGDLYYLAIVLFFLSVMPLSYEGLSTRFSRCLGDVYMRLIAMLGPVEVCSISVENVSAGTSSSDKGPITCKIFFPETFPSANQSR